MIRYSQQDARWKNLRLGVGEETIGSAGCLITAMAMACQASGFEQTPATLNAQFVTVGGFWGSYVVPDVIHSVVPGMRRVETINCKDVAAPVGKINKHLKDGNKVIVKVDSSPADGIQDHWVLLTRWTGQDYMMLDPWPLPTPSPSLQGGGEEGEVSLLGRYGQGKTAEVAIIGVLVLAGGRAVTLPTVASPTQSVGEGEDLTPDPFPEGKGSKVRVVSDWVWQRAAAGLKGGKMRKALQNEVFKTAGEEVVRDGITWQPVMGVVYLAVAANGENYLEYIEET